MYKKLFVIMLAALALGAADAHAQRRASQITMTVDGVAEVNQWLEAKGGGVTIDWGDGTPPEAHEPYEGGRNYKHEYSDTAAHTIVITARGRITELQCAGSGLTALDVSRLPDLENLQCSGNQLTGLDVSRNGLLTRLHCYSNQLTRLDVSKNPNLRDLNCRDNQLTSLDVSNNELLTELDIGHNLLPAAALDALLESLNGKSAAEAGKSLWMLDNPGTYDCRILIAQGKGWDVYDIAGDIVAHGGAFSAPPQMTLTLAAAGEVKFILAGSGQAVIDWGDGSPVETRELAYSPNVYEGEDWGDEHNYSHVYSGASGRLAVVSIAGRVNELTCPGIGLTALDISNNPFLAWLSCGNNQLTSLEAGKSLYGLNCNGNQLTSLDLSKSLQLRELSCSDNQLTSLDLSNNTELQELYCSSNQLTRLTISTILNRLGAVNVSNNRLSGSALNAIFRSLHSDEVAYGYEGQVDEKVIDVSGNPGADACDPRIAERKGWEVTR